MDSNEESQSQFASTDPVCSETRIMRPQQVSSKTPAPYNEPQIWWMSQKQPISAHHKPMESDSTGAGPGIWLKIILEGLRMLTWSQGNSSRQCILKIVPGAFIDAWFALAPGYGDGVTISCPCFAPAGNDRRGTHIGWGWSSKHRGRVRRQSTAFSVSKLP